MTRVVCCFFVHSDILIFILVAFLRTTVQMHESDVVQLLGVGPSAYSAFFVTADEFQGVYGTGLNNFGQVSTPRQPLCLMHMIYHTFKHSHNLSPLSHLLSWVLEILIIEISQLLYSSGQRLKWGCFPLEKIIQ